MYRSIITLLSFIPLLVNGQSIIPLYNGGIPNSVKSQEQEVKKQVEEGVFWYFKVNTPTLEVYLPPKGKTNGSAVIIVPGGGYGFVSYTREGIDVAKAFNELGITAFILKYRLPSDNIMIDKTIGPLQDAQQAIKTVRLRSRDWGLDPAKIGIIGFSAGGHLASTAGTHFLNSVIDNREKINLRPDFMILIYPVISLTDELMHRGSRDNLIGKNPSSDITSLYSNEMQVTAQTPPTILIHAGDDKIVKVENSLRFYESLLKFGVPAEMHIYPKGSHGFGLNNKSTTDKWMDRVSNWLRAGKFIS